MKGNESNKGNCVLIEDLECTGCGACRFCDLKPKKVCDNCGMCLSDADYSGIIITGIRSGPWPEKDETKGGSHRKGRYG